MNFSDSLMSRLLDEGDVSGKSDVKSCTIYENVLMMLHYLKSKSANNIKHHKGLEI